MHPKYQKQTFFLFFSAQHIGSVNLFWGAEILKIYDNYHMFNQSHVVGHGEPLGSVLSFCPKNIWKLYVGHLGAQELSAVI